MNLDVIWSGAVSRQNFSLYQISRDVIVFVELEAVHDDAAVPPAGEDVVAEGAAVDQLLAERELDVGNAPLAQGRVNLAHDL